MYADLEAYAERPDANEFIISRRNEIIDIIVTFYNVALERIKELEFEKDLLLSLNSFSNFNRQLRDIEQKRHIIKAKYGSNTTEKNSQEKTVH